MMEHCRNMLRRDYGWQGPEKDKEKSKKILNEISGYDIDKKLEEINEEKIKIAELSSMIKKHPNETQLLIARGLSYWKTNEHDKAIDDIDLVKTLIKQSSDPNHEKQDLLLKSVLLKAKWLNHVCAADEAIEECNEALEMDPYNVEAKMYKKYAEIENIYPNYKLRHRNQIAEKFNHQGNNYLRFGYTQEALYSYSDAIQADPKPQYYCNRAAVLSQCEKFDEALVDCNKSLELDPKHINAYLRKARILRDKYDFDGAEDCYKHVLAIVPSNKTALNGLLKVKKCREAHVSDAKKLLNDQSNDQVQLSARTQFHADHGDVKKRS